MMGVVLRAFFCVNGEASGEEKRRFKGWDSSVIDCVSRIVILLRVDEALV